MAEKTTVGSVLTHASSMVPQQIIATTVGLSQLTSTFFQTESSNSCAVYGELEVSVFCFALLQVVNVVYVVFTHREYLVTSCEFYYDLFPTPENKGKRLQVLKDISHYLTLLTTIASGFLWVSASNVKYLVCVLVIDQESRSMSDDKYQNLNVWVAVLLFTSSVFSGIAKTFHDYLLTEYPNLKVGTKDDDDDEEANAQIESVEKAKPLPVESNTSEKAVVVSDDVEDFDV